MSTKTPAPWADRLTDEFTAADEWATRLVQPLNTVQLNWRPRWGAWSIGQCLEHLAVSSEVYLPPIVASLAGRPRLAREVVWLAQHLDVNRIRFVNPFVWVIRFTAGTGLEILSQHERRHLQQAERVRGAMGFP